MKKLHQKGFGIVELLLVFVLVGLVGGIGFYVFNQSKKNDETAQPSSSTNSNIEYASTVSFVPPNTFSEDETKEISEKIVDPYVYFSKESLKLDDVTVVIERSKRMIDENDFQYSFSSKVGGKSLESFLFGRDKKIEYWAPRLCDDGGCQEYPDDFKTKFPKNYEAYVRCNDEGASKEDLADCAY